MTRRELIALSLFAPVARPANTRVVRLPLRSRVELYKGSGVWREVRVNEEFPSNKSAVLICDMWDNHWCSAAARRVGELTKRMAPFIDRLRGAGFLIIHSPSDVMGFYQDTPQRLRAMNAPTVQPPGNLELADPPLPIDDKDGGCDSDDKFFKAWSRQHSALKIAADDVITDKGVEVYNVLHQRGIDRMLVMGVHTNMCVLNRSFAIKQMTRWGIRCVLVRDLTDSMYDPRDRPFVPHDQGTALVVEHIEKHWAPSVTSAEVLAALTG